MKQPICLFDSGIGGLTVLKKLINKFPQENYIYLADLARVPFGDKKQDEIKNIASEIIEWLFKFNPKLIIMACNTSSAVVLDDFKQILNIPVYGMIENCAKDIAKSPYSQVTVWATKLVAETNAYRKAIQKTNSKIKVEEIACPKLVPMIENLNFTISERTKILQEYLDKTSKDSQALVLGCTHYPLVKEDIENLTNLNIIDPIEKLLKNLETHLSSDNNSFNEEQVTVYTTAELEKMQSFSKLYLCGDFRVGLVSLKKIEA